jgi:class 3 adenylate cyclase
VAAWLERTYRQVFILPDEPLKLSIPLQYGFHTFMAFFSAWVCAEMPRQSRKFGFLFGASFLTLILSPALAFNGLLFEPLSAVLATWAAGLAGILISGTGKSRREHWLRPFFAGRLSESAFEQICSSNELPKFAGRRELTFLSCRVLNSAELASELEPGDMEKLSSGFLEAVAEFLVSEGAYLDSCNADGLRVMFGFPLGDGQHAATACRVAIELRQRLHDLTLEMENRWHKKPVFGIALASGEMTCGLFGFGEFQFYGAVGESLEFASHLCSINLVYGSQVLIANRTFQLAKDTIEVRPMEMVFAPKIHAVSEVYELLSLKDGLSQEDAKARDAFWQGVVHLRKADYKAAIEAFGKARIEGRDDVPLNYFAGRAENGAKENAADPKGSARHARQLIGG